MLEFLPLIGLLLTPLWGYLIWRRMKKVQMIVNQTSSKDERIKITPSEDSLKTEGDLTFGRSLSFDDNLAEAERKANEKSIIKELEGRKY
jgi:hypothetical protein